LPQANPTRQHGRNGLDRLLTQTLFALQTVRLIRLTADKSRTLQRKTQ